MSSILLVSLVINISDNRVDSINKRNSGYAESIQLIYVYNTEKVHEIIYY